MTHMELMEMCICILWGIIAAIVVAYLIWYVRGGRR